MDAPSAVIQPSWRFIAATRVAGLLWLSWLARDDGWFLAVGAALLVLSVPYGAWTGRLKLNPQGLERRTIWQREFIPWSRIRDITVDKNRVWGHRINVFDEFDPELKRPNRVVLSAGGSLMGIGKLKQQGDLAELRHWWAEYRGAERNSVSAP